MTQRRSEKRKKERSREAGERRDKPGSREGLEEYAGKRDTVRSGEPAPQRAERRAGHLLFVVHKHAARRLHYDLRLELDGVLKSWAVPKGPSLDPKEKRLAVMVEDHPLDYASFEGSIPEGEYGAGQVIVWDNGVYSPEEEGRPFFEDRKSAEEYARSGLAEGKLSVLLHGKKLRGSWALVRTRRGKDWLLIKHDDAFVQRGTDILAEDRSVASGLTVDDLKAGRLPPQVATQEEDASSLPGAKRVPFPRAMEPMLASLTDAPFSHADWLFEPKLDGIRAVALIKEGWAKLVSRRGNDITRGYPLVVEELARQPEAELVLDGELVAPDEEGRPSFQRLQQRMNLTSEADIRRAEKQVPVVYYAFDLLYARGYDVRAAPLEKRKSLLARLLLPSEKVLLLDHFEEEGVAAYEGAIEQGLEGVVAKRRDSTYKSGQRSPLWLKVKATTSDEFVVGGYTVGTGGRNKTFGSLLLGQFDEDGKLRYMGNVGSGFDDRTLGLLKRRLDDIRTDKSPFSGPVESKEVAEWVRPELVAEVKFAQRTGDGKLRAPVFLALREDKPAREVGKEKTVAHPNGSEGQRRPAARQPEVSGKGVERVLEQIGRGEEKLTLVVEGHKIALSNLDKPLWPEHEKRPPLTKGDLLVYLARVSPHLLPHLRDRPLTLKRYPNGIYDEHFYQKHWDDPLPEYVETVRLYSETNDADEEYLLCNNLPTLLWLGQIADLELHTWYSRVNPEPDGHHLSADFTGSLENLRSSLLNYPDFIVFDLDPYIYGGSEKEREEPVLNRRGWEKTCEVAHWLREQLAALSLSAFVKTSGKTGLHIYAPIVRRLPYESVRAIAETVGRYLMRRHPREITMDWAVEKRRGKVFFDHNQNSRGKTLATAYSPRDSAQATVAAPLLWEELDRSYPIDFTILNVPERLQRMGDPWRGILDAKVDLGPLLSEEPQADADGGLREELPTAEELEKARGSRRKRRAAE